MIDSLWDLSERTQTGPLLAILGSEYHIQYRKIYNIKTERENIFWLLDVLSCTCLFRTPFILVTDQTTALSPYKENLKSWCHVRVCALVSPLSLNQNKKKKQLCK